MKNKVYVVKIDETTDANIFLNLNPDVTEFIELAIADALPGKYSRKAKIQVVEGEDEEA